MTEAPAPTWIPVCGMCRGSGIKGCARNDKRDRPPVERCPTCGGSGSPKPKQEIFAHEYR